MVDIEIENPIDVPEPKIVEYDPITGVPSEFNEYLPKDCEEYKKWTASQTGEAEASLSDLKLDGGDGEAVETEKKPSTGGKKKKQVVPMVVLERNTRNKKKCITTVMGLDTFGVKLSEASKLFGKKFASGSSVTKNAEGKEHIDVQGDFLDQAAELILKQFSNVQRGDIYIMEGKKKEPYFTD